MREQNLAKRELEATVNYIRILEEELEKAPSHLPCKDLKKEITDIHNRQWEKITTVLKSFKTKIKLATYNHDGLSRKRRLQALINTMPEVIVRYKEKYPQIEYEKLFIGFNTAFLTETYDFVDDEQYLSLAATLWIADEICFYPGIQKLLRILPIPEEYDDDFFPNITDTSHPKSLLKAIYYIVRHRNDTETIDNSDFCFVNETSLKRALSSDSHTYSSLASFEELNCRERFDALISMIHPLMIERACNRFKENSFSFLDLYFDCYSRATDTVNENKRVLVRILKEREQELRKQIVSPIMNNFLSDVLTETQPKTTVDSIIKEKAQLITLDRIDEAQANLDKSTEILTYITLSALYGVCSDDYQRSMTKQISIDPYTFEQFSNFTVENPYETAFALLYLIDSGSDIPWLYSQGLGIANAAANLLPWARRKINKRDWESEPDDFDTDFDLMEEQYDDSNYYKSLLDEDISEDDTILDFSSTRVDWTPECSVMYDRKYTDSCLWNKPEEADPAQFRKMNFAQIIYELGLGIIPRDIHYEIGLYKDLMHSGFSEKEAKILELYISLVNASEKKEQSAMAFNAAFPEIIWNQDNLIKDEETEEEPIPATQENDDLSKQIEDLKRQIKSEHAEKNELRRKLKESEKGAENLQKELDQLRECLQRFEAAASEQSDIEDVIPLPYTASHKIVVFGGHETWLKAIREKVLNVRFIDRNAVPNTDLILHAEAIFIQSNAIPHRSFNRIAHLAREHDIPMEYFKFPSAEKCAQQLAKYDMEF